MHVSCDTTHGFELHADDGRIESGRVAIPLTRDVALALLSILPGVVRDLDELERRAKNAPGEPVGRIMGLPR